MMSMLVFTSNNFGCKGRVARRLGSRRRFIYIKARRVRADLRAGAGTAFDCSEFACDAAVPGCLKRHKTEPPDDLADEHRHLYELDAGRQAAVRAESILHSNSCTATFGPCQLIIKSGGGQSMERRIV